MFTLLIISTSDLCTTAEVQHFQTRKQAETQARNTRGENCEIQTEIYKGHLDEEQALEKWLD